MANQKSVFETLSAINVNDKVEKKNNLTYLSWAWAWGEVKKNYPDATYEVINDPASGTPYFFDQALGYLVMTSVTIQGQTLPMWLPVMDGANNAMKHVPSEIVTRYGSKPVAAATMFDINKTLMRCLTKNLAMFGLGHYIYAGDDLPEVGEAVQVTPAKKTQQEEASLKPLKVGDENWGPIEKWVIENKEIGIKRIVDTIERKYKVTTTVKNKIQTLIK